jgi:hypothetical protein
MRRPVLVVLPLLIALTGALAGCLGCEPLADVRHLTSAPEGKPIHNWTQADAEAYPTIHRLIEKTTKGDHAHAAVSPKAEESFWLSHGIDPASEKKELFVSYEEEFYRLRILSC